MATTETDLGVELSLTEALVNTATHRKLPELEDLPAVVELSQLHPRFVADNQCERAVSLLDKVLSRAEDFLTQLLAPLCCQWKVSLCLEKVLAPPHRGRIHRGLNYAPVLVEPSHL